MHSLDLERPEPTLAAWSRMARPIRIGRRHNVDLDISPSQSSMTPLHARLDDILFGFSVASLLLVWLVFSPLAAWLR